MKMLCFAVSLILAATCIGTFLKAIMEYDNDMLIGAGFALAGSLLFFSYYIIEDQRQQINAFKEREDLRMRIRAIGTKTPIMHADPAERSVEEQYTSFPDLERYDLRRLL